MYQNLHKSHKIEAYKCIVYVEKLTVEGFGGSQKFLRLVATVLTESPEG